VTDCDGKGVAVLFFGPASLLKEALRSVVLKVVYRRLGIGLAKKRGNRLIRYLMHVSRKEVS
jgi:hypothetical protein